MCGGPVLLIVHACLCGLYKNSRADHLSSKCEILSWLLLQGPLYFWSYWYYLSKYYEFVDTVLLVLKVIYCSALSC